MTFKQVIIYASSGAYPSQIGKQTAFFKQLNAIRPSKWEVLQVPGRDLEEALTKSCPKETLLVLPAGASSQLEAAFRQEKTANSIREFIVEKGARLLSTCGASYALSLAREFDRSIQFSALPLFEGTAHGPLNRAPSRAEAVKVTNGEEECFLYVSGGGTLRPLPDTSRGATVLARYASEELIRFGREPQEWENAALLVAMGKGKAVLTMPHIEMGPEDIHSGIEGNFPDSTTNWQAVRANLSSLDQRLRFAYQSMIYPLENAPL